MMMRYLFLLGLLALVSAPVFAQQAHPRIYVSAAQRADFLIRTEQSTRVRAMVESLQLHVDPYVDRHQDDPMWIVSRLQMYWKTKYTRVYVNGMDFSHGEGEAPVPTVRFSGSRDWDTDYLVPEIEDVLPYMDDTRGLYLQNGAQVGRVWEWVHPAETGHVIERINESILRLAEEAAFLYWLNGEEKYAVFAADILMKYVEGMYHREPPLTVGNHGNAKLMGLQTFEVIHERIIEPLTLSYDFLHPWLVREGKDLSMIAAVLKKWADQEIRFGVPDNNWNLMQARYITYLALALEDDYHYPDGRGQQYYLDQMLYQNSEKQKALVDVLKIFDQETAIWPETAGYSTGVSDDLLEIISLIDREGDKRLPEQFPLVEKAILTSFQYLFPNGLTVAFGDAKHARLRFNSLELLIAQYRKYGEKEKEAPLTAQLKRFIADGAYSREEIRSLFQLFLYVDELMDVPPAAGIEELVTPVFYAPNISWLAQRNGMDPQEGMMISKNASMGNHSHTNGINIELFAKGMVIAPDAAAGVSYWSSDHREYYSRFPAHNTVVVDGRSDYKNMLSHYAFDLLACYPSPGDHRPLKTPYTFSDVVFTEPSTDARQQRLTATVRTGPQSGYFVDIFRSARPDGQDLKHEYLFHGQGAPISLTDAGGGALETAPTEELSSAKGDLIGYNYFTQKRAVSFSDDFVAQFRMKSVSGTPLQVNLWMQGFPDRQLFTVLAPPSRAIAAQSVHASLYQQPLPTLVVRQPGEARNRPFVAIIEAVDGETGASLKQVDYFSPKTENTGFAGIIVHSKNGQTDYLFNDESGETEHRFDQHVFQGTYGVASYQGGELHSLFLGAGTLLESAGWKVEATEKGKAIWLQKDAKKLHIQAPHAFRLTIPLSGSGRKKASLTKPGEEKQVYTGRVITLNKERFAVFELPGWEDALVLELR